MNRIPYRLAPIFNGPIKAVIFDGAGTVCDFGSRLPMIAYKNAFHNYGINITERQARGPMGVDKLTHLKQILNDPDVAKQWRKARGGMPVHGDIMSLFKTYESIQVKLLNEQTKLIPGVIDHMKKLTSLGIKIATNTGYNKAMSDAMHRRMKEQGFEPDFSVNSSDVSIGRPYPYMIFRVMEHFGIKNSSQVIKIGDTPDDIWEGIFAKSWTIGIVNSSSEIGLSYEEWNKLSPERRHNLQITASRRLACANYVASDLSNVLSYIFDIDKRMRNGEKPL